MHSQREEVYSAAGDSSPGELVITTQIPSRLAGSENGPRMAEYSAQALPTQLCSFEVVERGYPAFKTNVVVPGDEIEVTLLREGRPAQIGPLLSASQR